MPLFEVELRKTKHTKTRVEAASPSEAFTRASKGHPGYVVTRAREIVKGNGDPKPDDQFGQTHPNLASDAA